MLMPYFAWPKLWSTEKSTWHLTSPRHQFSTPPFAWPLTTPRAPSSTAEPSGHCICQRQSLSDWPTSGGHTGPSGYFGYWTTPWHSLDQMHTKFVMPIPIWKTLKKRRTCTRRLKRLLIFFLNGAVKRSSSLNVLLIWVNKWLIRNSGTRTRFSKFNTG